MKSNAVLQKDVYAELKWDPRISEGDIGVTVSNGIVTLIGTIPSFAEKEAAEEAAKKVCGVTAVVNNIDVKLPGSLRKDDQDLAKAAVQALMWNAFVPQGAVKVIVEKGWLSLSGEVEQAYARQAAENSVRHLTGVVGVTNNITVKPVATVADIQNHIKSALHRHAEADASDIKIVVANGDVTLSGEVSSWDEKRAAEWAALGTAGVRKVQNNIKVSYL